MADTGNSQLYRDKIIDYYRSPRNQGKLDKPDFATAEYNPSCGDRVSLTGILDGDILADIKFEGSGCVVSIATTSLLTEKCKGMCISEILDLTSEDMCGMLGMELGPTRLKCAVLALNALKRELSKIDSEN